MIGNEAVKAQCEAFADEMKSTSMVENIRTYKKRAGGGGGFLADQGQDVGVEIIGNEAIKAQCEALADEMNSTSMAENIRTYKKPSCSTTEDRKCGSGHLDKPNPSKQCGNLRSSVDHHRDAHVGTGV